MRPVIEDIIDLDRYPLDRLESAEGQALVSYCREELVLSGMFNLAGLIRGEIIEQVVREVTPVIQSSAFTHRSQHNIYFLPKIEGLDPEHPSSAIRNRKPHDLRRPDTLLCSGEPL